MKVLVTGAAGFIGGHLCRELTHAGHTVDGADIRCDLSALQGMRKLYDRDLRDPFNVDSVLDYAEPDVVVHLAAQVGRLFGEDDLMHTITDNVGMTALVARGCGERGIRLMYASTSEIYGDNGDTLCDEDDGPFTLPHNLYGVSKGFGEDVCQLYAPDGLTIMRFSMPYGPGLPAGRGRAALINFLYGALHELPLTVHRGSERSWCWIGDTVRAVRLLLEQTDGGAFNIGRDDNAVPMRRVAEMACDLVGASHGLIEEVEAPGRQTVVKRLATQKIRDLGWSADVSLEEGMARTLEAVRALPAPLAAAA
jgi:nucleoside-diphosphate-sugar epimerase